MEKIQIKCKMCDGIILINKEDEQLIKFIELNKCEECKKIFIVF